MLRRLPVLLSGRILRLMSIKLLLDRYRIEEVVPTSSKHHLLKCPPGNREMLAAVVAVAAGEEAAAAVTITHSLHTTTHREVKVKVTVEVKVTVIPEVRAAAEGDEEEGVEFREDIVRERVIMAGLKTETIKRTRCLPAGTTIKVILTKVKVRVRVTRVTTITSMVVITSTRREGTIVWAALIKDIKEVAAAAAVATRNLTKTIKVTKATRVTSPTRVTSLTRVTPEVVTRTNTTTGTDAAADNTGGDVDNTKHPLYCQT